MQGIKLSRKDIIKGLRFPDTISKELAYIIGILAGDGSICVRKSKGDYCIKCVGDPSKEVEFYNNVLKPLFKKIFNINITVKKHDSGTTYGFRIYSKALVAYLNQLFELPIGKKYDKLKIPEVIKKNRLVPYFIQGLADTDFCVTYNKNSPRIVGCSKSPSFIKEVSKELKNMGFRFYEVYDYKIKDIRFKKGYSLISKVELNGKKNIKLWMNKIGFLNPKHLKKIKGRNIAEDGFEFDSNLPNCIHRPVGLSECLMSHPG